MDFSQTEIIKAFNEARNSRKLKIFGELRQHLCLVMSLNSQLNLNYSSNGKYYQFQLLEHQLLSTT